MSGGRSASTLLKRALFTIQQGLNLAIVGGSVLLAITVGLELDRRIRFYEATYGPADGDVIRGPALVILTASLAALLSGGAFLLLKYRQRWGCLLDALIWMLVWFPAGINLNGHRILPWDGYLVSGIACMLGILLAVATFVFVPWRAEPPTSPPSEGRNAGRRSRHPAKRP